MIEVPSLQYCRNLFLLTRYSSLKAGRPWKRSFCPFWLDLAAPCTYKIGFVSGCLSADGDKFLSVRLMFKFCGQKGSVCTRSRKLKRRQSYAVCVHEWLMHFFHIFTHRTLLLASWAFRVLSLSFANIEMCILEFFFYSLLHREGLYKCYCKS